MLTAEGYASVAHVPVLFDDEWGYIHEVNWHLRQRARLEWSPAMGARQRLTRAGRRYPTGRTLEQYARNLGNFFDWLEHRQLDWRGVEYTAHLVDGYQADMLAGRWGTTGAGLSASTVNGRVAEACNFLTWAAERSLRPPFAIIGGEVPVQRQSARSSHGHKAVKTFSRAGTVRKDPKMLRLPTLEETSRWLESVKTHKGATKALMCELILESAIRLTEAAEWRIDTLPLDPKHWLVVGDKVQVVVKHGAKGPKYKDEHGDEHGPARVVFMPLTLAEKLHQYRETRRLSALAKWVKSAANPAERTRRSKHPPRRLFLSEHLGVPVTRGSLYEAWTQVPHQPFEGWSPHGGRHYWACQRLLAGIVRNAKIAGRTADRMPGDWVTGLARTDLDIVIRPQLGHVDRETSLRYVQWVEAVVVMPNLVDSYLAMLEGPHG